MAYFKVIQYKFFRSVKKKNSAVALLWSFSISTLYLNCRICFYIPLCNDDSRSATMKQLPPTKMKSLGDEAFFAASNAS